jgi:putative oxidoreductase
MDLAFLIGRIILGAFYLYYAQNHFKNGAMMAGYAASKGVPSAALAVQATGVMMALGALSFITGILPTIGAIIIIVFLLPTTFMIHNFWTIKDPMARLGDQTNFLKNMALVASTLMFLAIPQPWPLSLGF